ncbi:MAG: hypothetical protein AAFV95_27390 [Bacteroidota bacterium]
MEKAEKTEAITYIKGLPDALIVQMQWYKTTSTSLNGIAQKIQEQDKDAKVFVFLHRGNKYVDEDVISLRKMVVQAGRPSHLFKCFLFADGRDFIYYSTQSIGLLGNFGHYMHDPEYTIEEEDANGVMVQKMQEVCVYEFNELRQRNEILPRYFNTVWNYYEFEFQKKIKELRLDLLSHLAEISPQHINENSQLASSWRKKIERNNILFFRLRSFLGFYSNANIKKKSELEKKLCEQELGELKNHEREKYISYVFDDCDANLTAVEAKEKFQLVCKSLYPIVDMKAKGQESGISLMEINQLLYDLASCIENN